MRPRMKLSKEGLELIKGFEGLRRRAARLPDGRWTIGYGHTLSAREGAEVTAADAELLLQYDLLPVAKAVNDAVSATLNQRQFDALMSFALNIGVERFLASDVLRHANAGRPEAAAAALDSWHSAEVEGRDVPLDLLIRRRAAEKALFLSDPSRPPMLPTVMLAPARDAVAAAAVPAGVARASVDLDNPEARVLVDDSAVPRPVPTPEPQPASPPESFTLAQAQAVAALLGDAARQAEAAPAAEPAREPAPEPAPSPAPVQVSSTAAMTMRLYSPYAGAAFGALPPVVAAPTPAPPPAQVAPAPSLDMPPPPQADGSPVDAVAQAAPPEPAPAPEPEPAPLADAAILAEGAPAEERLVLTPPPEVPWSPEPAPEPGPEPIPAAVVDMAPMIAEFETLPDEAVLFDEPLPEAREAQVIRHEVIDARRRFDWSETGAFIGMGVVGLIAFGSAMAAFQLANAEDAATFDQTTLIAWTLAVIGSLCVGVSSYNLYKRWGGPRD